MKYCVSSRVSAKILEKADEIKFAFRDRKAIPDFFERYPDKDIILQVAPYEEINWIEINSFHVLGKGHFVLCVGLLPLLQEAVEKGYRCYYGYPVSGAHEIKPLTDVGSEAIKVGVPLFFNITSLKDCKTRVTVNVAYTDGLPREDGVNGIWIRPEDVELYEPYVDVIEFESVDVEKEELLYRVYAEDHEWRHGLDLLINGLNYPGNNRLILSDMVKYRLDCGQACALDKKKCQICWRLLNLADPEKIRNYKEQVYGSEENPLGA